MVGFVGLSTYGSSLKLRRPSLNQRQFSYGVGGRSRRGRSVVATAVGVNVVKDVVVQEEDVAPSTSPRGMKRKILKDVVQREGIRLVIALFALVFATGASLFIPMMFGQVIRTVITLQPGEYSRLLKAVGIACALYIIEPLSTVVWVRTICAISDRIFKSLKIRLFQDILGHDVAFFDENASGELASIVSRDVGELRDILWGNLGRDRGVRSLLEAVGILVVITCVQPQLALVFGITVPVVALTVAELGKRLGKAAMEEGKASGKISSLVTEVISGVRTVKSFGGEHAEVERLDDELKETAVISQRIARLKSKVEALNRMALYATLIAISLTGGYLVMSNVLEPTMLLSFIGYVFSLNFAVQGISYTASDIGRALGTLSRIRKYLNMAGSTSTELFGRKKLIQTTGNIQFRNVNFVYPSRPDSPVLRGLNLTLEKDQVTALVGPSGAGKSTVVALLSRFYRIGDGELSLDGVDVNEFDSEWYTQQVALVSQEPVLFSGTVRYNIAYGANAEKATDENIRRAARLANATEFIDSLPNGLDTVLGERGGTLSGGQRQRIAIARAVLKDAPILILDEATSALDTESEKLVQEALDRLMVGRTSLVIAHRLSTVLSADKICVMQGGRVVEQGRHADLMRNSEDSTYKRLMKTQTSAFINSKA